MIGGGLDSQYLRFEPDYHQWDGRITSSVSEDIVKFALVVGNAAGHLFLHRLRWQNLNSNIDNPTSVESQVLVLCR